MNSGPFAKYNWISGIYDGERYLVVRTRRGFCIFDRNDPAGGHIPPKLAVIADCFQRAFKLRLKMQPQDFFRA